jgi:hypothetical protein
MENTIMKTPFLHAKLQAILGVLVLGIFVLLGATVSHAQAPSKVGMLRTTKVSYDTTSKIYSVQLKFIVGQINNINPAPTGFIIKRGVVGQATSEDGYSKIGKIEGTYTEGQELQFIDNSVIIRSGYDYLVKAYIANGTDTLWGEARTYMTCVPSGYCINMDTPQLRFTTDAITLAIPGVEYVYESFAQHRSFRVQGMVRYEILEGPDGMTIDPLSGKLTWNVPSEQTEAVLIKIRAYSLDSKTAEAFQQWYLSFATPYDLKIGTTSSVSEDISSQFGLYPNPVSGSLTWIKTSGFSGTQVGVSIINSSGEIVYSLTESINSSNDVLSLPTALLPTGSYFVQIRNGMKSAVIPFVVIR